MNVTAQNNRTFQTGNNTNRNMSRFDLSHEVKTTTTMGRITPIMLMETLPHDIWKIRMELMTRFAPLYLPIMHRLDVQVNFFYCPNRIVFPEPFGWESFISQKVDVTWPYVELNTGEALAANSLAAYFGIPQWDGSSVEPITLQISAIPFSAYFKIFDEYYRNPQLQGEVWEPLVQGLNIDLELELCLADLWNRDYFTTALPSPQAGDDVQLPLVDDDLWTGPSGQTFGGPFRMRKVSDNSTMPASDLVIDGAAWSPPTPGGLADGGGVPTYLDIQETSSTIRQVRVAARLLEFMEGLNRSSTRYRDFIDWAYDIDPYPGLVDRPVWIGGYAGKVIISEVLNTAENLASYGGQALVLEKSGTISYRCQDYGYIMGLLVVKPRTSYMQGIHKHFSRQSPLDYAFKDFAGIGDQAILGKEVNLQTHADYAAYNEAEWGYNRRFGEYRFQNDLTTGQMQTTWLNFHLARKFDITPGVGLNTAFVQCFPRTTDVFQVAEGEDEIFCHIYHDVSVIRALPAQSIPYL